MPPSTFNDYRNVNLPRLASECEAGPSRNTVRSPLGLLDGNLAASESTPRLSPMPHGYSDIGRRMPEDRRFLGEQEKRRVQWVEANGGTRKRTKYGPGSLEARIGENAMPSSALPPRSFHKASSQAAATFHRTLAKPHHSLPTDISADRNPTVRTKRRVMLSPPEMYQSDLDSIVVWPLEPFAPFPGEAQSMGINPWGESDRTRAKYSTADYRVLWTVWTSEPLPRPVACARLGAFLGKSTDKMTTWFSNRRQDSKRGIESGTKTPQIHPHPVDSQEAAAINMILSGVMTRDRFFQRYPHHPQFCQAVAVPQDQAVKNDSQPKPKEVVDAEVKDVLRRVETRPSLEKACMSQEGALARRQYQHLLDRLPTEEPSSDPVDLSETEDDEEEDEDEIRETSECTGVGSSRYRSTDSSESEPVHDMWDSVDPLRRPMTPTSSYTAPPSLSWTPSSWTTRSPFTPTGYPRPTLTHKQSCDRTTLNLDDREDSIESVGLDKLGSRSLVPLPLPSWITESGNTTYFSV